MKKIKILMGILLCAAAVQAQPVPSPEENIPFACTFSKDSDPDWGDDDFVQILFLIIPETWSKPVFVRVFDPDLGGQHDENHNAFNSKTKFSVFGGKYAHSEADARNTNPVGKFKSGVLLYTRTFGNDASFDNNWCTFGPFNPKEGELQSQVGGYVIKIVIEGLEGDDGNLYKLFLSADGNKNEKIPGANIFAYEYTFRLNDKKGTTAHLYPFIAEKVIAAKISVFDYDDEGIIRIVSNAKKGDICNLGEKFNLWMESRHRVSPEEVNTSLDIQFIKQADVKNNNIAVYISNQFGEAMAFYTAPLGGIPKYNAKIGAILDE